MGDVWGPYRGMKNEHTPSDVSTPLGDAAVAIVEMIDALVAAGLTRKEALQWSAYNVAAGIRDMKQEGGE